MTRGEQSASREEGRGPGLAIAVSFVVLCIGVTFLVLLTTDACEEWGEVAPPPAEPFGGVTAALRPLGWRDGPAGPAGPVMGPAPTADPRRRADRTLTSRGYVAAQDDWDAPLPLPLQMRASLPGQCGVVALAGDGWASIDEVSGAEEDRYRPQGESIAMIAACGDSPVAADGSGLVHARSYALPGITPEEVEETGLPLDALLAHAEAEAHLSRLGWRASDEVVVVDVAPGAAAVSIDPPAIPTAGCVPWVAVGIGVGRAQSLWSGAMLDSDANDGRFTLGVVSCAPSGGAPRVTPLEVTDRDSDGGRIYFRPYTALTGPAAPPPGTAPAGPSPLHVVTGPVDLPDPVPAP